MGRGGMDALPFHECYPPQKESKARKKEENFGALADDERDHGWNRGVETKISDWQQLVCIAPVEEKAFEMLVENQPVANGKQEKEQFSLMIYL